MSWQSDHPVLVHGQYIPRYRIIADGLNAGALESTQMLLAPVAQARRQLSQQRWDRGLVRQ